MSRSEFVPGEVLLRRQYRESRFCHPWVLEDGDGLGLAWTKATTAGLELTLGDDSRYTFRRSDLSARFTVINQLNSEPLLETRWGRRTDEPIKFRGHDLHYSMTGLEASSYWIYRVREGEPVGAFALRIADGPAVALTLTKVKNAKKNRVSRLPQLGRVVVGEDTLGPDTALIASVGLVLLDAVTVRGGGG
jgi:hypothetical protein